MPGPTYPKSKNRCILDGYTLELVSFLKHLGVIISDDLPIALIIDSIANKAIKVHNKDLEQIAYTITSQILQRRGSFPIAMGKLVVVQLTQQIAI